MYKTLLVPLDGSPFAEHALPLALSIARRSGGELQLLFVHKPLDVVHPEHRLLSDESWVTEWKTHHRTYLDGLAERLRAAGAARVTPILREGDVASAIQQQVEEKGVNLVVMTTHARAGMARMWLGSVADRLVRHLAIPILLVRPGEEAVDLTRNVELKHFLVPLDGEPLAEQILEPAVALARLMDKPDFTLLRVIQPYLTHAYLVEGQRAGRWSAEFARRLEEVGKEVRDQAQDYLDKIVHRLRDQLLAVRTSIAEDGQPAVAILETADKVRADVIVMQTHGRGGLARLMLGSVADKVLRGAKVPLLLQRPK